MSTPEPDPESVEPSTTAAAANAMYYNYNQPKSPREPWPQQPKAHQNLESLTPRTRDEELKQRQKLLQIGLTEEELEIDFNAQFQSLYDDIGATPHDRAQREARQTQLYSKFEEMARKVVTQLVLQVDHPSPDADPMNMVIEPLVKKGVAGGEKYRVGQLFCKFARDDKGLYGGDDMIAAKMAKNEIRHSNAFLSARIGHMYTPMSAAFSIGKHVVIVSAVVPIDDNSLVYGSNNAARDIHDDSEAVRTSVGRFAELYGLAQHRVVVRSDGSGNTTKKVWLAFDCEVHESQVDGRAYVLDLGRMTPPNSVKAPLCFVDVFRPEWMRRRAVEGKPSLSADACTPFQYDEKDDETLKEAIEEYFTHTIPALTASLQLPNAESKQESQSLLDSTSQVSLKWSDQFHSAGVNMRHLPLVYQLCKDVTMKQALLDEIVFRVMKTCLRRGIADPTTLDIITEAKNKYNAAQHVISTHKELYGDDGEMEWLKDLEQVSDSRIASMCVSVSEMVKNVQIDWVHPPPFMSFSELDSHLQQELQLRRRRLAASSTASVSAASLSLKHESKVVFPVLFSMLDLYVRWHEHDPQQSIIKSTAVTNEILRLANDTDDAAIDKVASYFHDTGQYSEAEPLYKRALAVREASLGSDHPDTATSLNNLAALYDNQGRYSEAEPLYKRALSL